MIDVEVYSADERLSQYARVIGVIKDVGLKGFGVALSPQSVDNMQAGFMMIARVDTALDDGNAEQSNAALEYLELFRTGNLTEEVPDAIAPALHDDAYKLRANISDDQADSYVTRYRSIITISNEQSARTPSVKEYRRVAREIGGLTVGMIFDTAQPADKTAPNFDKFVTCITYMTRAGMLVDRSLDLVDDSKDGLTVIDPTPINKLRIGFPALVDAAQAFARIGRGLPIAFYFARKLAKATLLSALMPSKAQSALRAPSH